MGESNIVTLSGETVERAIEGNTPLAVLKKIVEQIERGELDLETIYVIGEEHNPRDLSLIRSVTWDSGMTIAQAVYLLENEKYKIIEMARRE